MKQKDNHQELRLFFKEQTPLLLFTLLGIIVFYCIFCLYQLEMEAYLYAAGLYLTALIFYLIIRFVRDQQRHLQRRRQLASVELRWNELPLPCSLLPLRVFLSLPFLLRESFRS